MLTCCSPLPQHCDYKPVPLYLAFFFNVYSGDLTLIPVLARLTLYWLSRLPILMNSLERMGSPEVLSLGPLCAGYGTGPSGKLSFKYNFQAMALSATSPKEWALPPGPSQFQAHFCSTQREVCPKLLTWRWRIPSPEGNHFNDTQVSVYHVFLALSNSAGPAVRVQSCLTSYLTLDVPFTCPCPADGIQKQKYFQGLNKGFCSTKMKLFLAQGNSASFWFPGWLSGASALLWSHWSVMALFFF